MRFLWILLGIIFLGVFIVSVMVLLFNSPFAIVSGQSAPLIFFGIIALLSLAASIYFMQKK